MAAVAAGAAVARQHARPHRHVVAAGGRLSVDAWQLVHAGIEHPHAAAVDLLQPRLHRGGDLDVDLLDAAAPGADRRARVDHETPGLACGAHVGADSLDLGGDHGVEGRIGAVPDADARVDDRARGATTLCRGRQRAEQDGGKRQRDGPARHGSAASSRTAAASHMTPTRAPTSTTPRRVGSYVTTWRSAPPTSTAYSTFSPRNVRPRTMPGTITSPSAALADSGTSVSDSGRSTSDRR